MAHDLTKEVLGVETELVDGKEIVTKIMGSKELLEAVRDQFTGARLVVRKPIMVEFVLPDIPAEPPRNMVASEKPKKTLEFYALAPIEESLDFKLTGKTLEGEQIADTITPERMADRANLNVIEGERAIYTLLNAGT